ncbi:hypothetical protein LT335_00435 [Spiroplasma sp. JKS002669]|uniref:hypothetical protein n=1 Tax=Spiroplasma attinicola TaxID=2904537 RepID=UPI0020BE01E0|nr:hypothetical protein [Spiroplasma sp. JKS002669]MCL6428887.1 hypothetical protein [Spiroplasma sp. JKS002669]
MNIFSPLKKVLTYHEEQILNMSVNDFYQEMTKYNFDYDESIVILGILLNKVAIDDVKIKLNLQENNLREKVIIDFAIFTYLFIGDKYNDLDEINNLTIELAEQEHKLFVETLRKLISNYYRRVDLTSVLGNDNDRANMFAVNALLNIKRGIGFDNFHITLFMVYQSLELKLKHCLKKYISSEPTAQKKQINFHNLIRLIKLISINRIDDEELVIILKDLREYLRYFEKINPGGQAARYEAGPNNSYFNENSYLVINEKELLDNFVHALSLLQKLYLKLIKIYDNKNIKNENLEHLQLDKSLINLIGANDFDDNNQIDSKFRNLLDQEIFGDYQELINLSYQELVNLRFFIRIGFIQYVNQIINQFLTNKNDQEQNILIKD